jgi:predicted component of type VI protein secretion system
MSLNARLVVVGGEVKTAEIKLRLPTTIGRGRGATIMLPHPLVSRQHCEIYETEGRLMVRDLGSLNGTFINNERISDAPLPSGELLTVGAVTFRAMYESGESSGPPTSAGSQAKSGKVRDTDANGTLQATATRQAAPKAPSPKLDEPGDVDFNFDLPLTPVDEGARVATVTKREAQVEAKTDATADSLAQTAKAELAKTEPAPQKAALPPTPAKPTSPDSGKPIVPKQGNLAMPAKPANPSTATVSTDQKGKGTKGSDEKATDEKGTGEKATGDKDKPVNFSSWDLDEVPDPKGESDDDFGDFLKSLESK